MLRRKSYFMIAYRKIHMGMNKSGEFVTSTVSGQAIGHRFAVWLLLSLLMMCPPAGAGEPPVVRITDGNTQIRVVGEAFQPASPAGEKPFTRIEGGDIGVYRPIEFSFRDLWPPFWNGRGVSSGDFDNDGDDDLALASSDRGLHIFRNIGGGRFEEVNADLGRVPGMPAFIAAFVDLNNDGWLDIVLTTYQAGNYVLWNDNGEFSPDRMTTLANRPDAVLAKALSFADVDRDGDLDIAVGNWSGGWYRRIPGPEALNRIIFNEAGTITGENAIELRAMPGETLSILLSDIDLDGDVDLLEGNDFEQPDVFYLGDGTGKFRRIGNNEGIIPVTTTSTMSMKTADLDNDLIPEIYISQIAGRAEGISKKLKFLPIELICADISNADDRARCQKNIADRAWYRFGGRQVPVTEAFRCKSGDASFEAMCKAMLIKDIAIQRNDPNLCQYISVDQPRALLMCEIHFRPKGKPTREDLADNIQQIMGWNVLLTRQEDGTYADVSKSWGLDIGGWSWDIKIADVDLDEMLDVYITNGHWIIKDIAPSNLHYRNLGGRKFVEASGDYGLEEHSMLPSLTAVDFENDGDQDFIGQAVNGPVIGFINNAQNPNRIGFRFQDEIGNRFGIGNRVVIRYGDGGGRHQMRELQSGGGFLSFDAPKMFFGLGDHDSVASIEVFWSTGERNLIEGPFKAGAAYTIFRQGERAN